MSEYPENDDRDPAYRIARGTAVAMASLVPGLGAVAAPAVLEAIDGAIGQPLARRQAEWLRRLGERVAALEAAGRVTARELGDDPEFVSIVAQTIEIARRNHREEKLAALQNVVENAARGYRLEEALAGAFLGYIDRFAPLHLDVLRLLANPGANRDVAARFGSSYSMGGLEHVLRVAFPYVKDHRLLEEIFRDLGREELVRGTLGDTISGTGMLSKRTTARGDAFVTFISSGVIR